MKKTIQYIAFLAIIIAVLSFTLKPESFEQYQTNNPISKNIDEYSNWAFILSDKAMQVRYKLEKQEGDIGYFKVQFRINFEDEIYCKSSECEGYLLTFGYPTFDGMNNIYSHYKFYNSYIDIYTMPELMPLKLLTRQGGKIYLKKEGFFFMFNNNEMFAGDLFYNCVDEILSNNSKHRCNGSYRNIYDESKAILLK